MKTFSLFKTLLLICSLGLLSSGLTAQSIITIDNNPGSTSTYTTLQDAHDNAMAGDIIYVQPSGTSYGTVTVDKPLTIIGRSHSEPGKVSRTNDVAIRTGGVTLKGLYTSGIYTTTSGSPNTIPYVGLEISRCNITTLYIGSSSSSSSPTSIQDVEIRGNIIRGSVLYSYHDADNILLANNIISNINIYIYDPTQIVITNNHFRSSSSGGPNFYNYGSVGIPAVFYNNMFTCSTTSTSSTACEIDLFSGDFNFGYNLFYNFNTGNTPFIATNGVNLQENNSLIGVDPLFTDVDPTIGNSFAGSSSYNPAIRLDDDLTLQATSPALTGGGSGGQIGLYNNGFVFDKLGNPKGYPLIDILGYDGAIPENGNINVTIKATAK